MIMQRALGMAALSIAIGSVVACGSGEAPPTSTAPTPAPAHATGSHGARGGPVDLSGPEFQGDHSLPGDPVAGELVYTTHCIACHAADGSGNGGITGGDFVHDRSRLAKNNETLLHSIQEGIPNMPAMPAWGTILTEEQRRNALAYIRQHFTPAELATAP